MPLYNPRTGESIGFNAYPIISDQGTLGNPEHIIWSSIRHLCSRGVAEDIASRLHGVKRVGDIKAVSRNLKLYIQQAHEFYEAAQSAKANTAPLIYYYSFLNLAKALCEIRKPGFHKRKECYGHGISWRPNPNFLVNLEKEVVSLSYAGVWHALWETLTQSTFSTPKGTKLSVKDMFLYCPEVSVEAYRAFGKDSKLISLINPDMLFDSAAKESWIRFSINRQELRQNRLTASNFINTILTSRTGYSEVRSDQSALRTFESLTPIKGTDGDKVLKTLHSDVMGMNLFSHLNRGNKIDYSIPLQHHLPLRMPQIMVLYSILFWLGSLVRYDPHSLHELRESHHWSLIDGFMSQSRLWLLEQFEWSLYQTETTLWVAH